MGFEGERLVHCQRKVFDMNGLKAIAFHHDRIGSGRDVGEPKDAVIIGRNVTRIAGLRVQQRDFGSADELLTGVTDNAADAGRLRFSWSRQKESQEKYGEGEAKEAL